VLAVFVLGALFPRVGQRQALVGLGAGLALNLALAGRPLAAARLSLPRREALVLGGAFALILAALLALPRG
jgi:hypothetical protein